jgi:hypothetical protein
LSSSSCSAAWVRPRFTSPTTSSKPKRWAT